MVFFRLLFDVFIQFASRFCSFVFSLLLHRCDCRTLECLDIGDNFSGCLYICDVTQKRWAHNTNHNTQNTKMKLTFSRQKVQQLAIGMTLILSLICFIQTRVLLFCDLTKMEFHLKIEAFLTESHSVGLVFAVCCCHDCHFSSTKLHCFYL